MGKKRGKFQAEELQLQMTPMIDIVFQLLIFFLVATKFRVPEGELDAFLPPDGNPPAVQSDIDPIQINLKFTSAKSEPAVIIGKTDTGATSMAQLRERLKAIGSDREMAEKVPVIINSDPAVPYRYVIETLNYCKSAKFSKVNFAAAGQNQLDAGK